MIETHETFLTTILWLLDNKQNSPGKSFSSDRGKGKRIGKRGFLRENVLSFNSMRCCCWLLQCTFSEHSEISLCWLELVLWCLCLSNINHCLWVCSNHAATIILQQFHKCSYADNLNYWNYVIVRVDKPKYKNFIAADKLCY